MFVFLALLHICVIALVFFQIQHYLPQLPALIDFNLQIDGKPFGPHARESLITFYLILQGYITLMGIGAALFLDKMPLRFFNIPHRDDWLSPPHRQGSFRFLKEAFWGSMVFTSAALAGFMEAVFQSAMKPVQSLPPQFFHALIALCIICPVAGYGAIYLRFCKKERADTDQDRVR